MVKSIDILLLRTPDILNRSQIRRPRSIEEVFKANLLFVLAYYTVFANAMSRVLILFEYEVVAAINPFLDHGKDLVDIHSASHLAIRGVRFVEDQFGLEVVADCSPDVPSLLVFVLDLFRLVGLLNIIGVIAFSWSSNNV